MQDSKEPNISLPLVFGLVSTAEQLDMSLRQTAQELRPAFSHAYRLYLAFRSCFLQG